MIIRYTDENKIDSIITTPMMVLNPILAIFNLSLVTVLDSDTNRVLALNKLKVGQLFTKRFDVIGNYRFYLEKVKLYKNLY